MNFPLDINSVEEQIIKSDWVQKKTTGTFPVWKKRYLVLQGNKLKYYHKETQTKPAAIIDFDVLTVEPKLSGNDFILSINGSRRDFRFRCNVEQEARDWVYDISIRIQNSRGSKVVYPVASTKKYWRFDRISLMQFEQEVQTGDLLLFRGKSALSKMQRAVTRGKYDHVALLIRSMSNDNIFLFEVTGLDGVTLLLWGDFLLYQWHNLYSRLTYKKIIWDRSEEKLKKLNDFIHSVQGMEYSLSAGKLLRKRQDKQPQDKKGFFCSELIATAMKECGLLNNEKPSSKYWPGDFDDDKLQILPPARCENGVVIDFNLN